MKDTKNNTSTSRSKISITILKKLLDDMDKEREITEQNRSTWVSSAIMEKLGKIKKEREN